MGTKKPLDRLVFQASDLMAEHPPVWYDPNKQVVFDVSSPPGSTHAGEIVYTRWPALPLPARSDPRNATSLLETRESYYDYVPLGESENAVDWHVNFADPDLFVAYNSSLFAQDEMQVTEHPALGALREALDTRQLPAVTVQSRRPTPVTITGVERRCHVATDVNIEEGRPAGLYGNAFSYADKEVVRRATTRIDPPTITNLIAMAAPVEGYGKYQAEQIRHVLDTAFTGFRCAISESERLRGGECPVIIHTGFWGCGAFGGNRILMTILQLIAAEMAHVDHLVMHTFDATGTNAVKEATTIINTEFGSSPVNTDQLIDQSHALGFQWGISDGN